MGEGVTLPLGSLEQKKTFPDKIILTFAVEENLTIIFLIAMSLHKMPSTFKTNIFPLLFLILTSYHAFGQSLEYYKGSEQSIKNYINSNLSKLDPIEGFYSITTETYDAYGRLSGINSDWARLAIIRDENSAKRDFIEINLTPTEFQKFAISAEFTKTANDNIYLSKQFNAVGKSIKQNYIWDGDLNLLTSEDVKYYQGNKLIIKSIYTKISPKGNSRVVDNGKIKFYGTCFAISKDGLFATNFHVIESGQKIKITLTNKISSKTFKANLLMKDQANDIAIIKIDDPNFISYTKFLYSISDDANLGSKIFTIGYPLVDIMGGNIKFTEGSVSSKSGFQDDGRFLQISAPIQQGNSGGPLFNSKGQIIGITTAKLNGRAIGTDVQNVNYALKSDYLVNLLKMLPTKPDILGMDAKALSNLSIEQMVENYKDYIGVVVSEN